MTRTLTCWSCKSSLLVLAAFAVNVSPASATLLHVAYDFALSEKELVLAHPDDHFIEMREAWDQPHQRIAARNMPFIELRNSSNDEDARITEFRISIGDTDFEFSNDMYGEYAIRGDTSSDGVSIESSTVQDNGELLIVNIDGLDPGEVLRFRIEIDPKANDVFPYPDFRTVLFDMNGDDSSDNSKISVVFTQTSPPNDSATLENMLPDYDVEGPQAFYANANMRGHEMEGVDIFPLSDSRLIPEPSSLMLLTFGCIAVLVSSNRLRSSRRMGRTA